MSTENEITWGNFKNPLIITGGIGIFISFILLVFSLITDSIFVCLVCIIIISCFIITFKSSIESFEATLNGLAVKFINQENKVNAIAARQAEPIIATAQATLPAITSEAYGSDNETDSVIKAISGTKYTFRNIDGIIADSNLEQEIAKDKLNWLLLHKLANSFDIDGEKLYALSPKGRKVFAQVLNPPKQKA